MKSKLLEEIALTLLKNNFIVKTLTGSFDILARKDDKILLLKVLEDANSISPQQAADMEKISSTTSASPLIISNKAGQRLYDNVIYQRFGIYTITPETLRIAISNKLQHMLSTKSGLTVEVIGAKLKSMREAQEISTGRLSKLIGVSKRMILKYEHEDSEISLKKAVKIYEIFGTEVFKPINLFESEIHPSFTQSSSQFSKKYQSLGFSAADLESNAPFDIIAKREKNIIFTSVGDTIDKNLQPISRLVDAEDLVIFKKRKPKNIPALTKKEFLELQEADELIKFLKEFEL